MSALRWRLDLINKELSEGVDKVIWMDLSTLIASDMSCLYQKLSHFIYRVRILRSTCTCSDLVGRHASILPVRIQSMCESDQR
jgi:hypothetical protein